MYTFEKGNSVFGILSINEKFFVFVFVFVFCV